MKKKIFTVLSIIAFVLLIAGCQEQTTTVNRLTAKPTATDTTAAPTTIDVTTTAPIVTNDVTTTIIQNPTTLPPSTTKPTTTEQVIITTRPGGAIELTSLSDYYRSVEGTYSSGQALFNDLKNLINKTHTYYTSYDSLKWVYYYTDSVAAVKLYQQSQGTLYNGSNNAPSDQEAKQLYMFYTNNTASFNGSFGSSDGTINREHVFPQSFGPNKSHHDGSDAHHVRPIDFKINGTRGNNPFKEILSGGTQIVETVTGITSNCLISGGNFQPEDDCKGDTARIIFYVALHYYTINGVSDSPNESAHSMGYLSTLLKWNREDPVDDIERARQENVFAIQGNRNPFIDYPEFADYIWA